MRTLLLALTMAPEPIAVAFVKSPEVLEYLRNMGQKYGKLGGKTAATGWS
jgi:hypothetical protein